MKLTSAAQNIYIANMVLSRAESEFILEHYFVLNSFNPVREASSNAYPGKVVPNHTIIHRLVHNFGTRKVSVTNVHLVAKQIKLLP